MRCFLLCANMCRKTCSKARTGCRFGKPSIHGRRNPVVSLAFEIGAPDTICTWATRQETNIMRRNCPACSKHSIEVSELFFSPIACPSCGTRVGVHWIAAAGFSLVILLVTVVSTLAVFSQMGFYAAILWFSFHIGSLTYIKVRFLPLEAKQPGSERRGGSAT